LNQNGPKLDCHNNNLCTPHYIEFIYT